jgi:hypothetical protein
MPEGGRFHVLRFMMTLKAARDFGLEPKAADAIAMRFDPLRWDHGHLVDALTAALVERGVVDVPGSVS